jgi:uncharacterized OB-fold protein
VPTVTNTRVPAVEGWFTTDGEQPALIASRCTSCGAVSFPRETYFCKNPDCLGREFDDVELSRRGTIWSFTSTHYQPPPPYVSPTEEFEPFTIAAVTLEEEGMVVLGQTVKEIGVADLAAGDQVELVIDTLYEDDDNEYLIWKWAPA